MNCPNCNKKPVGLFHQLRFPGVGFKKGFKGYFKCKHCGTLLKELSQSDISKYDRPYWYLLGGYLFIILAALFLLFYLLFDRHFSDLYSLLGFTVFVGGLLGIMNSYIKPRYWVIKEVSEGDLDEHPPRRLTSKGWIIFISYSIVAIALFITIPVLLPGTQLSESYVLSGSFLYGMGVIGGGMYILHQYSTPRYSEKDNG